MSTKRSNRSVNLTKTVVDKTPTPATGQAFIRDSKLPGFGMRITSGGARTFIVEKRIDGRVRRIKIGRFGELTCEQARKEAQRLLGRIAVGENPIAERERERMAGTTLEAAFADFFKRRELKEKTLYDYRRLIEVAFQAWRERPISQIGKREVLDLHRRLGEERGEAYANLAMRFLRSLFNFAIPYYEDAWGRPLLSANPVAVLSQTRAWFHGERRQTIIKPHQLPGWRMAVERLRGDGRGDPDTIADYLLFLLYTGLRKEKGARLTWADVDLNDRSLKITDTKNREAHLLPLPAQLVRMLKMRRAVAPNVFVFWGSGKTGHLIEPKRQVAKVVESSGVHFTLHDLRRTFITVAESLDVTPYALKRLVNHKMKNDVTAGYIVASVERLREPMQRIADFLDKATHVVASAEVVALDRRA